MKAPHTARGARNVLAALGVKLDPSSSDAPTVATQSLEEPTCAVSPALVHAVEALLDSMRGEKEYAQWLATPRPLYTSSELQAMVRDRREANEKLRRP